MSDGAPATHSLVLEACTIDLERRRAVRVDGSSESLTEQELGLLLYLAERAGRTVPRGELLDRVWGYSAKVVTRAIDVAVRRLRQKIEADASRPRHVVTVRGVGYRFEAAQAVPEPAGDPPSLPHERSSFVGRADELAALEEHLAGDARLVTLTGPPGVGKSRLALRAARGLARSGTRVLYVALAPARSATDLLQRTAAALGVPLGPVLDERAATAQLAHALQDAGASWLLVDDAEHLVEPVASAVSAWLAAAGALRVLVTSRERLRVRGESAMRLPPLGPDDARALLVERAGDARAGWGSDEPELLDRIAQRLDCNPLAMELAAARAEVLSPADLLTGLDQRFRLLGAPSRDPGHRQATLERAIDWSWSLLSPWEQSALAQCSVFEAGFSLSAATRVVDLTEHPDAPWALDQVQALVGRSLVQALPSALHQLRFHIPESIRAFARARGAELDVLAGAIARHRAYFLELGETHVDRMQRSDGSDYLRLLALEADNLRSALRDALEDDPDAAARLALALDVVFAIQGPASERAEVLTTVLERAPSPALQARIHLARARARILGGHPRSAFADGDAARRLARTHGDDELRRRVLLALGELYAEAGDMAQAHTLATLCADQSGAAGDVWFEARALRLLAQMAFSAGDLEEQGRCMDRLEALAGANMDPVMRAHTMHLLGRYASAQQRHGLAMSRYREAMELCRAHGYLRRVSLVEADLACELCLVGDLQGALEHFLHTLELHRRMGHRRSAVNAQGNAGQVLLLLGRTDEALDHLDIAVRAARSQGTVEALGPRLATRGLARLLRGDARLAREDLEEAIEACAQTGRLFSQRHHSAWAAAACAELGDLESARTHALVAEALLDDPGPAAAFGWVARGWVARASGDEAGATEALQRATALSRRAGSIGPLVEFVVPAELDLALGRLRGPPAG